MKKNAIQFILVIIGILALFNEGFAQLKANFTIDKNGGCAPFRANFINKTEGATANAVYNWNFGNGNSSSLQNCGAVFLEPKTYNVTLTVIDNNKTSAISQIVTVYYKPVVDFTANIETGCTTLPVLFTINSAANESIAGYFWDFGDGTTFDGTIISVAHTYTTAQKPSISLTATSTYGCQSTIEKQNILTVLPKLTASFKSEKTYLCTLAEPANFINNTSGPGTLKYVWDFGDGTTSTGFQPSHQFKSAGTYTIKLLVTNTEGCNASSTENTVLNVTNFKSIIDVAGPFCEGNSNQFFNKSTPVPDNSIWEFDNSYTLNGNENIFYGFTSTGQHLVKLTNTFGECKNQVTKIIDVNTVPVLTGFLTDIKKPCGSPVTVNFKDTCSTAVKWQWNAYYTDFTSNIQSPDYVFSYDNDYYVNLKVTNAAGCIASTNKLVAIHKPIVEIESSDKNNFYEIRSCGPKNIHFNANTIETITSYNWNFGDGSLSSEATPVHYYSKAGDYIVHLNFTTINGCSGEAIYQTYILIRDKVKADFSISNTNICGNTPVTFSNTSGTTTYYYWDFGDGNFIPADNSQYSNFPHQFQEEGLFTIRFVATDLICTDTMVKVGYVTVSPPFPKINYYTNTCDGNRGEVTFNQSSNQVVKGSWDFGDGTPLVAYADQPQIKHTYTKTGWYKVMLTTTNGICTVKDSINVSVLLKQHPVLTADKTVVCSLDDYIKLTYSNLEVNPSNYSNDRGFDAQGWYHRDGSFAPGGYGVSWGETINSSTFTINLSNFTIGKEDLRSMVVSHKFGCTDTTNFIPLKIKGPIPGYKVNNKPCTNGTVVYFQDTSKPQGGIALVSWEWNFSDGPYQTYLTAAEFAHSYYYAQPYRVSVKVKDAEGCTSIYYNTVDVLSNGLKAAFTTPANTISPGTTINFSNSSTTTDPGNTQYRWLLGDGTEAASYDAVNTYSVPGTYTVKLIAFNILKGCADTAITTIIVKYVNAAFTFNTKYISTSKCTPVVVNFINISNNINKITWNFGDGTIINDVFNPSHVYTKPGFYKIKMTTYSDNNTPYVTEDSIKIKELTVKLSSNILRSCTAQSITLSAISLNATNYLWDFGDGTLIQATDTFAVHNFANAGIYTPTLIVKDTDGCEASASITEKIIIDSLHLALDGLPQNICTPKAIYFNSTVINIAADQALQKLIYHWDFGTGKKADTANIKNTSFNYQTPGNYTVNLKVQSPFGCTKNIQATIIAKQGLGAVINGPSAICQETTAIFTGSTQLPGQPKWHWLFDDGTISDQQNPPAKLYHNAGSFIVKLIADNNGCADTITATLKVVAKPAITLSSGSAILCEGSQRSITVTGGDTYSWSPSTGLNNTSSATVIANPVTNTTYNVTATNNFGCSSTGTVVITVVHPFTLNSIKEYFVCIGKTVSLNVSGANTYQWINNTIGLNNTLIANPISAPKISTIYTVVGTDINNCFKDTADIKVTVKTAPTVDAGQSALILAGTSYQLQANGSNDVVQWTWTPAQYLNCSNCAAPVTTPLAPMLYTVTATNVNGCTAYDTVSINLMCSESRIYIPKAFTPDNDGVNDLFVIKGAGIKIVNHLRIYDRYGGLVFERNNFSIGDVNAAWDGRHNGAQVSPGAYVYIAEMSCNEKTFVQKGTVTVIY